jgi:hypothetical protein
VNIPFSYNDHSSPNHSPHTPTHDAHHNTDKQFAKKHHAQYSQHHKDEVNPHKLNTGDYITRISSIVDVSDYDGLSVDSSGSDNCGPNRTWVPRLTN